MNKEIVNVLWCQSRGYWDNGLIIKALQGSFEELSFIPNEIVQCSTTDYDKRLKEGGILIVASRFVAQEHEKQILSEFISSMKWCLLFVSCDEEGIFPAESFSSDKTKVWIQNPDARQEYPSCRKVFLGWPEDTTDIIKTIEQTVFKEKTLWGFSGQLGHSSRIDCLNELSKRPENEGYLNITGGFSQGLSRAEYFKMLCNIKIAPCPSGPQTPDTFRLWEAIEAGCIPIVNKTSPTRPNATNYWKWMNPDCPIPSINSWSEIHDILDLFKRNEGNILDRKIEQIRIWWENYKKQFALDLSKDVMELKERFR